MRVLFLSWPAVFDASNAAARSLRTLAHWMADAGHEVTMLSGGTFRAPNDLGEELRPFGIVGAGRYRSGSRSLVTFNDGSVKTLFVCTMATEDKVEATDIRTYVSHGQRLVRDLRPQLVVYMGGERGVREVARLARNSSSRILGTAWEFGWESREAFESAHQVVCGSQFLSNHYRARIGLQSLGYPPPVPFNAVVPSADRPVVLVTQTRPEFGAAAVTALRDRGFRGAIRVEGRERAWAAFLDPADIEFVQPPRDRARLWQDVAVALTVSVEAAGTPGAEAVLNRVPVVADQAGPNEETSGGFGRFLAAPPEQGEEWAQAVMALLESPPDAAEADAIAHKLYAPEIQRNAYVRLMERVQAH